MSRTTLLGIDVGTSAVKAALTDSTGRVLSQFAVDYPTRYLGHGLVEQDPEDWWLALVQAMHALRNVNGSRIPSAIGIASHAPTGLAVTEDGTALRHALIWPDTRAVAESEHIAAVVGEARVRVITGNRMDPSLLAPKALWLQRNEPIVGTRLSAYVQVNGWLGQRLSGQQSLDHQHASLLGLRDTANDTWSTDLLTASGIEANQLGEPVPPHLIIGHLQRTPADQLGLPEGLPVVAGTVDSAAAAIEGGISAGVAVEMAGSSSVLIFEAEPGLDLPHCLRIPSAIRTTTSWQIAPMSSNGSAVAWLADVLDQPATDLIRQAECASHEVPTFVPYLDGERAPGWRSAARGHFANLTTRTHRGELARAVMEGTAMSLRRNLELIAAAGVKIDRLHSVGGAAQSDIWSAIKADVIGLPVHRLHPTNGAALIAGRGIGLAAPPETAADLTVSYPRQDVHGHYDQRYRSWLAASNSA